MILSSDNVVINYVTHDKMSSRTAPGNSHALEVRLNFMEELMFRVSYIQDIYRNFFKFTSGSRNFFRKNREKTAA